jgi:hypothetical protein
MILDRYDPIAAAIQGGISQERPDWYENFAAGQQDFMRVDSTMSRRFGLEGVWRDITSQLNEELGDRYMRLGSETGGSFPDPTRYFGTSDAIGNGDARYTYEATQIIDQVLQLELDNPGLVPQDILSLMNMQAIEDRMREDAMASREELMRITEQSRDTGGFARFMGGLSAGMYEFTQDPAQVLTLFAGGSSRPLLTFAAREALLNASIEVMRQPQVAQWYGDLGLEYTAEQFYTNVAVAGAAGAGFAVGFRGAGATGRALAPVIDQMRVGRDVATFTRALDQAEPDMLQALTMQQLRSGIGVMETAGVRLSSEARAAIELASTLEEIDNLNPGLPAAEHARLLDNATIDVANGQIPEAQIYSPPEALPAEVLAKAQPEMENLGGVLYAFDPRDILVDARTFQFKGGGDEFGVTDRLQFITEWDPQLAGVVTVYEYADGRLFIADGHQRVGLARRLMAGNPDLNIQLYGYRLREIDGITPEQAMISAAVTNIAQGTGSIIDAAKIARMDPERFRGMVGRTLPPTSQLVRQAQDMMTLTQDAFGAVINDVIPSNYGAIVGRLLADRPELQQAAIGVLARAEPANVFQAEAIVRQVREADADVATQQSLFGEEMIVESLYTERARVLDRAVKQLRQDRAAFANLVRNAENIESAGNVLDRSVNERRADLDAQAIALVQTLANRKGALSDALSGAARIARDSGSYATPTRQFVESIRRSITDGDFERLTSGEVGRIVNDTPPSRRSEVGQEPSLTGFDEPTGHGAAVEQQADDLTREMFPEPEPAPEAAPIVRSPKQIEADLKARQPVETVDDIYALAPAAQDYIAGIGRQIQDELGVEFKNPGLKNIETARAKMARKNYVSSNQMTDISRAGFVVKNAADANAIAARFGRETEILDEGWNVTPEGYFDRKLLVRTPNGIVSEIQIWPPELLKAKTETGHRLYKRMRASDDPEVRADLAQQQRELYAAAINREDQSFRALLGIEMAPKVPSNADLNAASLAITRPVDQTSAASTGVQAPPGSRMATASLGEMEMAGRPSQSTSIIDQTPMDEVARAQQELFAGVNMDEEIPVSAIVDPETGEISAQTMTMRDLKQMLDEEDSFIDRLGYCTR